MTELPRFHLKIDQSGASVTVTVGGDIDIATVGQLVSAREQALKHSPDCLRIDLRRVGFIDSSGLKFLLDTNRLSREDGWDLQLLRPGDSAMKVFIVTGADKHLPFVDAVDR